LSIRDLSLGRLRGLLVFVRRRLILVRHQARLLVGESDLLASSAVVGVSGVTTAVAAAAAAEKETPDGDSQSARCHADQANADAGDDANEDGQEDMRSDVREQLAPPALLERTRPEVASRSVVRAMMRIVMRGRGVRMVRVMMRRRRVRVVRTVRMVVKFVHLASMAVPEALEALEFLPGHRQHLHRMFVHSST